VRVRLILSRPPTPDPRPPAILLHEPFFKLDAPLRGELRKVVFNYLQQQNAAAVLATDDQEDTNAAGGIVVTID
jgi:putative thiamine transport system ATP-binding protein